MEEGKTVESQETRGPLREQDSIRALLELLEQQGMPDKIRYNMKYIDNRCLKEYFKIIFLTLMKIVK